MTENEIKEYVTEIRHKADIFRKSGFATAGFATHFDKSADIIEELLPYMAIGTVEELKEAKEQFDNINSCANSVALCGLCDFETAKESVISTIKAMKDEAKCDGCAGCTVWKCDIANERAFAIDKFAERMKQLNEEGEISVAGWNRIVDNIAEQMKAGGIDG